MPSNADAYWLALRKVHGVGPRTCRLLLGKFGSPEKIFALDPREISAAGVPLKTARAITEFRDFELLEKELCELPRIGARMVRWTDDDYPPNLRHIADPPPYLFVRGDAPLSDPNSVAIVGARAASNAGLRMAERLGFELVAKGFTVVSGLARGIDGASHRGALDAGGRTIAVMGCGIDVIYPAEHRTLADEIIAGGGALLTELSIGTQPLAENFPTRNRILSGLCLGVVIVEAAEKSGSLITARMALEQDRQVFAVPGSPLTGRTRGSNRLIKDGAKLVECVEDVIEELAPQMAPQPQAAAADGGQSADIGLKLGPGGSEQSKQSLFKSAQDISNAAKALISQLSDDHRLHVDALIESSGLDAQTVLRLLLELELKGIVAQHPGKLFSLA
ncbi:MAG TPA: DNA-processing protein DprA [Candidatus Binataceae bacterium]|nr:DNA-processing protein DprA [Candidatus Binataceae bacterium]